jgi:predicted DNA-binding protein YlxM (UPF0122 family)
MKIDIEKKNHYNLLYGYYRELFTSRQQEMFEDYYEKDFSLAEIALNSSISRNAVWTSLQTIIQTLDTYEEKMALAKSGQKRMEYYEQLSSHVDEVGQEILKQLNEME